MNCCKYIDVFCFLSVQQMFPSKRHFEKKIESFKRLLLLITRLSYSVNCEKRSRYNLLLTAREQITFLIGCVPVTSQELYYDYVPTSTNTRCSI